MERSVEVLATAPHPRALADLASRWCEVEPMPRPSEAGEVRVCYPDPPVQIDGIALTLEVADTGVIGLVAPDLPGSRSAEVANAARAAVEHLCRSAWALAPDPHLETCRLAEGSQLVVGRVRSPEGSWQVSIAVVGVL